VLRREKEKMAATPGPETSLVGIPIPQIVAFAVTIIAAYFSARWGSAESRKQFEKKTTDDERAAAAELIPLLLKFAADCEQKFLSLSTYISTEGHDGKDESMSGIVFDPKIHTAAARLGPRVTERAIKLALTQARAEAYVGDVSGHIEEDELNEKIISFLSLLCLRARFLVDLAAEKAGLRMRHSEEEMERLRKQAFKSAHEIDSADETRWD
jgi:hypothetical protein